MFQEYKTSRAAPKRGRQADSPISKYKALSPIEKKSIFKMRDVIDNSPGGTKRAKLPPVATNKRNVVERLRVSQRMIEMRENLKKKTVDGSKDLLPDDGDHGQGYAKRAGV